MSRKSIFDQIDCSCSYYNELNRLNILLSIIKPVHVVYHYGNSGCNYYDFSVEEYIDSRIFKQWKSRGSFINIADMKIMLGINDFLKKANPSFEEVLTYLEYVINLINLYDKIELEENCTCEYPQELIMAKHNIKKLLEDLNYEEIIIEEEQKVILAEKDAATTAVAEIVEAALAKKLVQYNHFLLKGNLELKKDILVSMGYALEPFRSSLSECNKNLEKAIFYLLNNLSLRHNNRNSDYDKKYKYAIDKMLDETLEQWYDELYQMILLGFLELEQLERYKRYKELKKKIETKE